MTVGTRVEGERRQLDMARLRSDAAGLSRIERRTGTPGERRSARWVAGKLRDLGAVDVRTVPFRTQTTWAWSHVAHHVIAAAAAASSRPVGRLAALATLASYEADNSGRTQWLRRLLPAHQGVNVVARLPSDGEARRRLVLVAHHDAAHTGWVWNRRLLEPGRRRAARTGAIAPFNTLPLVAMAAAATPVRALRAAGAALLSIGVALALQAARSVTVPGANDNASGLAALLELARHVAEHPIPGLEVILLVPGGEEAGMVGMGAWMRQEGRRLENSTTLFLGLDTLGAGEPVVAEREGWTARYRQEDLVWAERGARAAGLPAPAPFGLGTSTDPMIARHAGYTAVSILSQRGGSLGDFHLPADVTASVDWSSVAACTRLAAGIIDAWAAA